MWRAWSWDPPTVAVWMWVAWFAAWETAAILRDDYWGTWTAHLRPVFLEHPLTWWLGVGAYTWFGLHIFAPAAEQWLKNAVGRGTP